ncbi:proteophosphoglycan precursor [Oceanicola sp. 22II-s10i]|uniref:DUF1285 domain-containing protein n=1 Tax=Oceanicola sp. 22II-s10i TaxID=1317116 RepID=UPI000B52526B|nr:DUF1285 domain-containing protein [Oceanicola sp. 22II-s10i]OWU86291.1 proteophosphoglycan precursor [Oceanicola sp. 22II-s10i]
MAKLNDGQIDVKPSALSIAASIRAAEGRGLPPVDKWSPDLSGDMDLHIARDGTWFHEGTAFTRPELVRLFSTILRRDGDEFFLVTPVEKWRISVEDAPFLAVDVEVEGEGRDQSLTFLTNVGDKVTAGPDHPIRVAQDDETGEPAPYVLVRGGLEALIDRKSFYRIVDTGETVPHEGAEWFGLWSDGAFFPIEQAADLPPD